MIFHPCTAAGRFQPRFSLPWLSFFGFFDLLLLVTSTEVLSALLFAAALRVFLDLPLSLVGETSGIVRTAICMPCLALASLVWASCLAG